jgi:nucleoside-diphosphate-sugar epimerase
MIHLAAEIDFAVKDQDSLYSNNVVTTKNAAELAKYLGIKKFIFTSSNSIFLGNKSTYIDADETPVPIDPYGQSKYDGEKLLVAYQNDFLVHILRCPNIIDAGRVGMLSILFDLLKSNATLWVIGGGRIKHQCLYAQDLNLAINKLFKINFTSTHNIGSDNVPSFFEMFNGLISLSGSRSRIRSLPSWVVIPALKFLYKIKLSPMGPYQFRMLTKNFAFDTSRIKSDLNWAPTKNNTEILEIAYEYYLNKKFDESKDASANSAPVKMGILKFLRFIKI